MEELNEKLALHKEWVEDNTKGLKLDLSGVDLSGVDLSGVDLSGANLRYANLRYANLRYANLSGVDLSGANLSGANLRYANLSNANLSKTDLRYCTGNNIEVKSLQIGTYLITYTKDILNIGCQSHAHSKWKSFYDDDILSMDGEKALDWWSLNKHIIFELIDRENK